MEREPQHFHMQQQVQQQAGVWGLGPVAPQPPQVQQQAVMDASYLQGIYEHAWDEQQTVQMLRVALQGLQLFPKDASLLRLVWRLRKELKAWGESGHARHLCGERCWYNLGHCMQDRAHFVDLHAT
jgi:hypothetical protein